MGRTCRPEARKSGEVGRCSSRHARQNGRRTGGSGRDNAGTTAETSVLYGAEFTGGTDTTLLEPAARQQLDMAKEILGVRNSADNVGVLLELGWTGIETKATRARLMFW